MSIHTNIENPLEHEAPEVEPNNFWAYVIDMIEDDLQDFQRLQDRMGEHEAEVNETQMYLDYAKEKMEEDK